MRWTVVFDDAVSSYRSSVPRPLNHSAVPSKPCKVGIGGASGQRLANPRPRRREPCFCGWAHSVLARPWSVRAVEGTVILKGLVLQDDVIAGRKGDHLKVGNLALWTLAALTWSRQTLARLGEPDQHSTRCGGFLSIEGIRASAVDARRERNRRSGGRRSEEGTICRAAWRGRSRIAGRHRRKATESVSTSPERLDRHRRNLSWRSRTAVGLP